MAKPGVVATAHQHALARKARRSPRYVDDERQAVEDVLAALEAGLDAGTIGGDSEPGVELTFTCCKPDAVRRGLVGEIFGRWEAKGFELIASRLLVVSPRLSSEHYAEHRGKSFFQGLVRFMSSGPVVPMVWAGAGVVKKSRKMIGKTKPVDSPIGSVRGDYGIENVENGYANLIHGSDSNKAAARELSLWFPELVKGDDDRLATARGATNPDWVYE